MELKYLFNNTDLALMLLKNWEYDESSLDMFQYFRISANAVYPFRQQNQICLLRFCPCLEKPQAYLTAELEFINYLRSRHYQALEPLPAKNGELLVRKATPWGEYYACVFKRVCGTALNELSLDDNILRVYGAALGRLHNLSRAYTSPAAKRWTHADVLTWIEETLHTVSDDRTALEEVKLLDRYFSALPVNRENYGLVHYDFEFDNVFYDKSTNACHVIDFDDAMYHWYIMDIEQALDTLKSEVPNEEFEQAKTVFLGGYETECSMETDWQEKQPFFRRFADLYAYTRVAKSLRECWDNEPEWLVDLRKHLKNILAEKSINFGKLWK